MVAFVTPEPAAAPPPAEPALRDYNFRILCDSGEWRDFRFQAVDFVTARKKLIELKEAN